MGIDSKKNKSYSAAKIKAALEALGATVSKCGPTGKNFLVAIELDGRKSTASCALDGKDCKSGGLTGTKGLKGVSDSDLKGQ